MKNLLLSQSTPSKFVSSLPRVSVKSPKSPSTTSISCAGRSPSSSCSATLPFPPRIPPFSALSFSSGPDSTHDSDFEQMSVHRFYKDLMAEKKATPRLVADCSEQQLLLFLPLVMHSIQSQLPTEPSPLLRPLLIRLCLSRRLKLRFLLLRKHPAFHKLQSSLSFVSRGYNEFVLSRIWSSTEPDCVSPKNDMLSGKVLRIPVDMVDLQTEDFFRNIVFEQPRKENHDFGFQLICHPFRASNVIQEPSFTETDEEESPLFSSQSDAMDDYYPDQQLAESATVHVEEDQIAIELRHLSYEEDIVSYKNMIPLLPRLIVRTETNMLKTQLCQMMFVFFNSIWSAPSPKYPNVHAAPICVTFDVIASGRDQGLIRAFCHVKTISSFRFDFWQDTRGRDPVVVDEFIRSAAGAFTAAYICGINTLQKDAFCVKDGTAFFLYLVEDIFQGPAQPKIGIPKIMRRCFIDMGSWDDFRACCMRAFHSLRERYSDIFSIMLPLFSALCDMDEKSIWLHLYSKYCFNLKEQNPRKAAHNFGKWLG
ncbi:unnamed protein product [Agarophyton chilense]